MGKTGGIRIDFDSAESALLAINKNAAQLLEERVNTSYQQMYDLLADSKGESVNKIKAQLLEEKDLVTQTALLFRELSTLLQKVSGEFRVLDSQRTMVQSEY